jgi:hypothetical protein
MELRAGMVINKIPLCGICNRTLKNVHLGGFGVPVKLA